MPWASLRPSARHLRSPTPCPGPRFGLRPSLRQRPGRMRRCGWLGVVHRLVEAKHESALRDDACQTPRIRHERAPRSCGHGPGPPERKQHIVRPCLAASASGWLICPAGGSPNGLLSTEHAGQGDGDRPAGRLRGAVGSLKMRVKRQSGSTGTILARHEAVRGRPWPTHPKSREEVEHSRPGTLDQLGAYASGVRVERVRAPNTTRSSSKCSRSCDSA